MRQAQFKDGLNTDQPPSIMAQKDLTLQKGNGVDVVDKQVKNDIGPQISGPVRRNRGLALPVITIRDGPQSDSSNTNRMGLRGPFPQSARIDGQGNHGPKDKGKSMVSWASSSSSDDEDCSPAHPAKRRSMVGPLEVGSTCKIS